MRTDKDYLMEMELWSHFEMRAAALQSQANVDMPMPASSVPAKIANSQPVSRSPAPPPRPAVAPAVLRAKATPTSIATAPVILQDPARAQNIAAMSWQTLQQDASACQACGLCKARKQVVMGAGAQLAPWMFIGEGPGAEEDALGEPFVGQAGKLLDAMLVAAGLQRGREVVIANVVKCRPPGNRTPSAEEATACAPYLDRQIALVQPKIIIALGKTAVTRLTGSDAAMSGMRGQRHNYQSIPVIATYHPAYLLRSLPEKLKAWEDLMFAKSEFAKIIV